MIIRVTLSQLSSGEVEVVTSCSYNAGMLIQCCFATAVTHTKRIYRNLLRKETSFVYYTSSVLRKSRHTQKSTHQKCRMAVAIWVR